MHDPIYVVAKTDLLKMIGILQSSGEKDEVAGTRVAELSKYVYLFDRAGGGVSGRSLVEWYL